MESSAQVTFSEVSTSSYEEEELRENGKYLQVIKQNEKHLKVHNPRHC